MKQEQKMNKKKKLLLMAGFMMIPIAALVFVFMRLQPKKEQVPVKVGINTEVPNSTADNQNPLDKLSVYLKADKDSAKRAEEISRDPYYQQLETQNEQEPDPTASTFNPFNVNREIKKPLYQNNFPSADANELKVRQKLAALERQLSTNMELPTKQDTMTPYHASLPIGQPEKTTTDDPEMTQLNDMLEKVLDIQHPERVQEKLKTDLPEEKVKKLQVQNSLQENTTDCMMPVTTTGEEVVTRNSFYESGELQTVIEDNAIAASIHETVTLIPGATIKLRLNQDMFINGAAIPKGTFVFGASGLQGDRLKIVIKTISFHNSIYPVDLSVYSLDGMEGILIPGAISRDVAKTSASQTLNDIEMTTLDPSFKAQAASAGVEAVKSLLGRKVKVVRVTLKAGPVLLRNGQSN